MPPTPPDALNGQDTPAPPAAARGGIGGLIRGLYVRFQLLIHELAKFGIVGAFNAMLDIGVFNLLRFGPHPLGPLTSKAISVSIAATSSYFMNRHWSFKHRERSGLRREYSLFFLFNFVGLVIAEACLAISHYGLGLHTVFADNIAANGFGLVLGTVFRFWAYRRFVFLMPVDAAEHAVAETV